MSKNPQVTTDALWSDYRKNYENSIDFYVGKDIKVKPPISNEEKSSEDEEELAGLEKLILGFSVDIPSHYDKDVVDGCEGIGSFAKATASNIVEMIKAIGRWLQQLLSNKVFRAEQRLKLLKNRRKINGIKTTPSSYTLLARRLYIPSMASTNPMWVSNGATVGIAFYSRVIDAHKAIISAVKQKPKSKQDLLSLQRSLLESIGRIITGGSSDRGVYKTSILPSNRIFNVKDTPGEKDAVLTYFTDSGTFVKLKSTAWLPTTAVVDDALKTLETFVDTLKKEQSNNNTLIATFARTVQEAEKGGGLTPEEKQYYVWLTNLNRRLTNTGLQYAVYLIEGLAGFINSGLKQQ